MARNFKHAEDLNWIPVDLTAALGVLVFVFVIARVHTVPPSAQIGALLALFVLLLVSAFGLSTSEYAEQKALLLFTSTALCAFAPFAIVATKHQRSSFYSALLGLGLVVAGALLVNLATQGQTGRLTAFSEVPIWAARGVGAGLVVLIGRAATGRFSAAVGVLVALPMVTSMVATGSRGPVIAVVVSTLLVLVHPKKSDGSRPRQVAFGVATLTLLLGVVLLAAPIEQTARLRALATGDVGLSGEIRIDTLASSAAVVSHHPLGTGLGTYQEVADRAQQSFDIPSYPHNVLVEVTLEAGWVAGLVLVAVLVLAVRTSASVIDNEDRLITVALLAYGVVIAMLSGDLNSNRLFFAMLGIGLAAGGSQAVANRSRNRVHTR